MTPDHCSPFVSRCCLEPICVCRRGPSTSSIFVFVSVTKKPIYIYADVWMAINRKQLNPFNPTFRPIRKHTKWKSNAISFRLTLNLLQKDLSSLSRIVYRPHTDTLRCDAMGSRSFGEFDYHLIGSADVIFYVALSGIYRCCEKSYASVRAPLCCLQWKPVGHPLVIPTPGSRSCHYYAISTSKWSRRRWLFVSLI